LSGVVVEQDFAKALPSDHPLHVGLYFSGYSHCQTPSPAYDRAALIAALSNPAVSGTLRATANKQYRSGA
jgi:hypothetical protein